MPRAVPVEFEGRQLKNLISIYLYCVSLGKARSLSEPPLVNQWNRNVIVINQLLMVMMRLTK